jgi:hypothetical protein
MPIFSELVNRDTYKIVVSNDIEILVDQYTCDKIGNAFDAILELEYSVAKQTAITTIREFRLMLAHAANSNMPAYINILRKLEFNIRCIVAMYVRSGDPDLSSSLELDVTRSAL